MWYEKYIGIPFKPNGRTEEGLDCWGLARLIYSREYGVELPSFSTEYVIEDDNRIKELISQYREGWTEQHSPVEGNIVLFRVLGDLTHMGVMISDTQFIHVREGSNTVLDSITNTKWKNRVTGFFKYNESSRAVLNAVPHPLKTQRITSYIPEGSTLEEVYKKITLENLIDEGLSKTAVIMVNGIPIPRTQWNIVTVKTTDVVEYRAVPGKEAVKMIAIIVIAFYAPQLAVSLLGEAAGAAAFAAYQAGATVTASMLSTAGLIASATIAVAGSYLINAIAPVRPPSSTDPGSSEQQNLISGARNPYNPYGTIPVVLGKIRMTAPLGAKNFASYDKNSTDSYLNMLLIWGYGPLTISDFRIGETGWDEYQFNTDMPLGGRITFDRKTAITTAEEEDFRKIYGNDVDQQYVGLEMVGPEYASSGGGGGGFMYQDNTIDNVGFSWNTFTGLVPNPPDPIIPEVIPG